MDRRQTLERYAVANVENVWNGRPISKILLREPLVLGGGAVSLIELIPPFHQSIYRMGLEHIGVVLGAEVDKFGRAHRAVLTGQQFQSPVCEPYYVRFNDYTGVKFYRYTLQEVCEREGQVFEGFVHVRGWVPPPPDPALKGGA
ncbi:VOC family protein [Deinococcus navajonensis]|uniref:VOC family protein n=1 Tax=Deinococcus navajonensis TaxID=309884 RepID=A0ABV8XPJ9_9DEIO